MGVIDMATYSYDLLLNDNGFSSKLTSAEGKLDSFALKGNGLSSLLAGSLKGGFIAAGAAVAAMVGSVASAGVGFDAMKEQSQIAWTTLLGGAKQANQMISDLQVLAAKTPFSFESADKSAKLLSAMGFAAKDVIPDLTILGNATSAVGGDQQALEGVATAIGQMKAKGKVSAEEMNQLAERGIPAWKLMADGMGISVQKLMALSSQGKIMASQGVPAMLQAMSKAYDGDMQRQSQSFNGLLSTIKDDFTQISGILAQPLFDKMKQGLASVTGMMDNFVNSLRTKGIQQTFANMFNFGSLGKGGGMFDGLINAAKNMGNMVKPILADMMNFANSIIANIKTFWAQNGTQILTAVKNVFNGIAAVINFIMPAVKLVIQTAWDFVKSTITAALNVIEGALKIFSGLFTGDWGKLWEGVKQLFQGALVLIINYFGGVFVKGLLGKLGGFVASFASRLGNGLKTGATWAIDALNSLFNWIVNGFKSLISKPLAWGKSLLSSFGNGIKSAFNFVFSPLKSLISNIAGFFKPNMLFDVGRNIIQGLVNGIKGMAGAVWNAVKSVAGGIKDKMMSLLGIHSPSKVMAELGGYITEGLANGILGNSSLVDRATQGLANKVMSLNAILPTPNYQYRALPDKSSLNGYNSMITNNNSRSSTQNTSNQPVTFQFGDINIQGVQDGKQAATQFSNLIVNKLNQLGVKLS